MERRRATAWAGSIALFGCAGALVLGSLAGGFGFNTSRAPQTQTIAPGSKPQPRPQQPAPGGAQGQPAPSPPVPETAPSDPGIAPASLDAPPAPDAAPDRHYPREPDDDATLPVVVPLAQTSAAAGSRDVPVPPRDAGKPDAPAEKHKPPAPIPDKDSHRDIPIVDERKRATEYSRARDAFEKVLRSKMPSVESSPANKGASVHNRSTGAGTKAGVKGTKRVARTTGHDG
jgi:hypothetical protein